MAEVLEVDIDEKDEFMEYDEGTRYTLLFGPIYRKLSGRKQHFVKQSLERISSVGNLSKLEILKS